MQSGSLMSQPRRGVFTTLALAAVTLTAACGPRPLELPEPRPLIISSGARLSGDADQLKKVYEWVNAEIETIDLDPSFWVTASPTSTDVYPWETVEISENQDTVSVQYRRSSPDLLQVYQIYAHLQLMAARGDIAEYLPAAEGLEGFALESVIMSWISDAWLLGRASFDFAPYPKMDELIYAKDAEMLDGLILVLRGYEFPEARDAWLAERPNGEEQVKTWYRQTFGKDLDLGM